MSLKILITSHLEICHLINIKLLMFDLKIMQKSSIVAFGFSFMLNSFLWSLGANGCSGYTGVITNGDNSYNFSLGLWKTCLNDECQTYSTFFFVLADISSKVVQFFVHCP